MSPKACRDSLLEIHILQNTDNSIMSILVLFFFIFLLRIAAFFQASVEQNGRLSGIFIKRATEFEFDRPLQ